MDIKLFVATKAFIIYQGKVLLLKESSKYSDGSNAGKFDIVGGRIEPGQRFDESLRREIQEETGLSVTLGQPFFVNEWRPVVRGEAWQIIGIFFECSASTDAVVLSSDHSDYIWIDLAEYKKFNLINDLGVAFEYFLNKKASYGHSH